MPPAVEQDESLSNITQDKSSMLGLQNKSDLTVNQPYGLNKIHHQVTV